MLWWRFNRAITRLPVWCGAVKSCIFVRLSFCHVQQRTKWTHFFGREGEGAIISTSVDTLDVQWPDRESMQALLGSKTLPSWHSFLLVIAAVSVLQVVLFPYWNYGKIIDLNIQWHKQFGKNEQHLHLSFRKPTNQIESNLLWNYGEKTARKHDYETKACRTCGSPLFSMQVACIVVYVSATQRWREGRAGG